MKHTCNLFNIVFVAVVALSAFLVFHVASRELPVALSARIPSEPPKTGDPQQYPVMDAIANKIVQKYQTSTCEQLWQEKAQAKNKPKSTQEQEAISMLRNDPQMRAAFISKIAAPIANKMFECGMIP